MLTAEDDVWEERNVSGEKLKMEKSEERIGVGEGSQLERIGEFGANQTEDTRWLEVKSASRFWAT